MKSYCISCKKDVEFLIGHLMTESHKKNTEIFNMKLNKKMLIESINYE